MGTPAIFLDRDGTLLMEKNYLFRPEDVEFVQGAEAALRKAMVAGFTLVMVTNQSGVGRGYYTIEDVEKVHEHIAREFEKAEVRFGKIYYAAEAPELPSRGRKPSPQFLFDARDELNLDLGRSYMIGDKLIDLQCGWNAGVRRSILVRTGYGGEVERTQKIGDAVVAEDLPEAVEWILRDAAAT
jgi:D-glycero-D-manno-heptose 1,7-bisphosphate phosphatase